MKCRFYPEVGDFGSQGCRFESCANLQFDDRAVPGRQRELQKNEKGAGDEARTRDIFLGKEVLYQLSYTRVFLD
jgi:hypothetical protein